MPLTRAQSRRDEGDLSAAPEPSAAADQRFDTPFSNSDLSHPSSPLPQNVAAENNDDTVKGNSSDEIANAGEATKIANAKANDDDESGSGASSDPSATPDAGANADSNDSANPEAYEDRTFRASGENGNRSIVPLGRRQRENGENDLARKVRRVEQNDSEEEEEDEMEDVVSKKWKRRTLFPNELMLKEGNTTAFKYKLLSGESLVLNYLDVFRASLKCFINENVLQVAADLILRERDCTQEREWVWMHETFLVSKVLQNQIFDRYVPSTSRVGVIMNSELLLVPLQTSTSMHWSLLVVLNLKSVLLTALTLKPRRGVPHRRIDVPPDAPKPHVIHFDSMDKSNHKSASMLFRKLITFFLEESWKEKYSKSYVRTREFPDFRRFVARNVPFLQAKVEQQDDETTCGWRVVDCVRHIAEQRTSGTDWSDIMKNEFVSQHTDIANRSIRFIQWKSQPSVSDLPSTFFPAEKVLDKVCCEEFECDIGNVNGAFATFFKSDTRGGPCAKRDKKKRAMAQKFEIVYASVTKEMETAGLNVRTKMNKTFKMKKSSCEAVARYPFPFPRGVKYATCMYYTRYNYPDSILVCTGLNLVAMKAPRIARETFATPAARVPKRQRVQYQMAVFLDWTKSKARRWETEARFRLQELLVHFEGIGEAILKSCCRQAIFVEYNAGSSGLSTVENRKSKQESDVIEDDSDKDLEWSFESSFSIENGTDENGRICCSVSSRDLQSALGSCLTAAEQIANESIMNCVVDFENHCKRVLQLSGNVKISEVECYVTASSMATIHTTFREEYKQLLMGRVKEMWGHLLDEAFIQGSVGKPISRLLDAAEKCFTRNGSLFLGVSKAPKNALLDEPVVKRPRKSRKKRNEEEPYSLDHLQATRPNDDPKVANVVKVVEKTTCFGLGVHTTCVNASDKPADGEFLALVLYLLQGCKGHERRDSYHCGDLASQKWGNELAECQKLLQDVWETFSGVVKGFGKDFMRSATQDDDRTFEDDLMKLKFDVVVRAASKIASVIDESAMQRSQLCKSDVFCYEIPMSYRGQPSVKTGKEFRFSYRGGEFDTALWHGSVTEMTSESITHDASTISVSEQHAIIGGFEIVKQDLPKLYRLCLDVTVESNFEVWSNASEIEAVDNSFLGFSIHECVRLVFAFHDGESSYSYPHPVTGNYSHSFIAIITSPCVSLGGNPNSRNPSCVGPRTLSMEVVVHDDLMQSSGCRCSIQDVIGRWRTPKQGNVTRFAGCYVMPLKDLSLKEDICQYNV